MTTIEERAKVIVTENGRFPFDEYARHRCDGLVQFATEQDRIARVEERERCVNVALFAHCKVKCDGYKSNHYCIEVCKDRQAIRKAMEGGNNEN